MSTCLVIIAFGSVIASIKLNNIINNLNKNLELSLDDKMVKMCEECGKRIINTNGKRDYCERCAKEIDRVKARERMKIAYKKPSIC